MSVTVFVWNMFKYRAHESLGVGHASLFVHGSLGSIYVSYWPAQHTPAAGWDSHAKIHFINGDKDADGNPDWASKPLEGLDEQAMITFWKRVQPNPLLNYAKKTPFQQSGIAESSPGNRYNILKHQCSTTVVECLLAGADSKLKAKIEAWKRARCIVTVTPNQVRTLVEDVF